MKDLRKAWTRLGVGFVEKFSTQGQLDLEHLIVDTCKEGRSDSRLLFGMRGWLLKHHDLVNVARLIRMVKEEGDTAVLGAIIESVVETHPRSALASVTKYCRKAKKREFVFERIARSKTMAKFNLEENLPIWRKWNLISNEMGELGGAIAEKGYIFQYNSNMMLRALFSPGIRAEVLSYLVEYGEGNARQISMGVGQSYEPVYSELKLCENMGLLEPISCGRATVYHLKPEFLKKGLEPLMAA
jgi:hypothetical protein